ncbi:MAG: PAS domain S-box protein [Nitrospinae bacterium]|nr:PAS domain S-box protein [Nitrospinota bacterium]
MKKVLLIEDDETITDALNFTLGEEGYEVLCAMDGEAGLEKARSEKPDVILLDIMLPKMNGFEVCQALKSDEKFKSIPIIMITGLGDTDNTVKGLSLGADDYVSKPFDFKELLARLKSHLRMKELYDIVKTEEEEKSALLDVSQSLASTMNPHETLYTIVSKIAEVIEVKRCSIIYVDSGNRKGYVMASHDSKIIKHLKVDIEKYPEILQVMRTGQPVVINDVYTDPILFSVRDTLSLIDIKSIMAFPISFKDTLIGTLILRTSRREAAFNEREIRFCEVISHLAASPLKNAYLFEILHMEKEKERNGRLEAEDALQRSEEKFRVLYENIPVPYQSLDESGRFIEVNAAFLKKLGCSREEIIGAWAGDLAAPYHVDRFTENFLHFKETGEINDVEVDIKKKDGSIITVSYTGRIGYDQQGKFKQTHCVWEDVTERKQADEKLKKALAEWDNTFNSISDFVSIHDTEFRIVKANKALLDFLKKRPEEVIGKHCYEIFHEKNEPWDTCPHAQTMETNQSKTEVVNDPHIGVPLLVTTCPIFDLEGKFTGSVHIAKDITEAKKAEEKLKEAFRELEEKTERLEKFNKLTVGREMDMVRLKREVNALLRESGKPERYEEAEKIKNGQ